MSFERLEIVRLTDTGDTKRRIICLSGRVSVFRARTEDEIRVFSDVLGARPTSERFSVLLDGQDFRPENHLFVGFEEEPLSGHTSSVKNFLLQNAFPAAEIETALLNAGLGGLSLAECQQLSPLQQRVLQLLCATKCTDKVIVLSDPFRELPETWREFLAKAIAEHAWRERVVVVVVRLTTRPEVWIDNEYIFRIQLEKPRERTIGFGAGEFSSAELVQAIREQLKKTTPLPKAQGTSIKRVSPKPVSQKPIVSLTAVPKSAKQEAIQLPRRIADIINIEAIKDLFTDFNGLEQRRKNILLGSAASVLALLIIVTSGERSNNIPNQGASAGTNSQSGETLPLQTVSQSSSAVDPGGPTNPGAVNTNTPAADADPNNLLAQYPGEIKLAILKSFREPKTVLQNLPALKPGTVRSTPSTNATPAKVSGIPTAVVPDVPREVPHNAPLYEPNTMLTTESRSEEDLEQQRQLLRQHFLEAVARARERQLQEEDGAEEEEEDEEEE